MTDTRSSPGTEDLCKMLDLHVDGVRHYLHLQIGKPLSKNLISAPEIALDNLHREVKAAIRSDATRRGNVDQVALDAAHEIEALPAVTLHPAQKTASIQIIVRDAINGLAQPPNEVYRETVRQVAASRERRLAQFREALESIAAWRTVNTQGEYEHGLRDIIRSITDCAAAALEASSVSSTTRETPEIADRWPLGCHSPNSCSRNGRCMYIGCRHDGKDIKALATAFSPAHRGSPND